MSAPRTSPTFDARGIAARLTGGGRTGANGARGGGLHALLAPLPASSDLPGLPHDASIAIEPDAGGTVVAAGTLWARTVTRDGDAPGPTLGVPPGLVVLMGTLLMGGTAAEVADEPTPIDRELAPTAIDALAGAFATPHRFAGWAPPGGEGTDGAATIAIVLVAGGAVHRIAVRAPRAAAPVPVPVPVPSPAAGTMRPTRRIDLSIAATLDLPPRTLGQAFGLRVGDVVPLAHGLDAVAVRVDGRELLGGALGHAGGRLCVRVAGRTAPEPAFEVLHPPSLAPVPRDASTRSGQARTGMSDDGAGTTVPGALSGARSA